MLKLLQCTFNDFSNKKITFYVGQCHVYSRPYKSNEYLSNNK